MKSTTAEEFPFICISCEARAERLYHEYRQHSSSVDGIIKIPHCDKCGEVVDKYIEYDLVIISLDAILLKRKAFRHILKNAGIEAYWKFCMVLLTSEAFTKLLKQSSQSPNQKWRSDHMIYSALEIDIYYNFIVAVIELVVFISGTTICMLLWKHFIHKSSDWPSARDYMNGLMLSRLGKVLILPPILWSQSFNTGYVWMCKVFTAAANIQAARVLCPTWRLEALTFCILATLLLENLLSTYIPDTFSDMPFN